LNKFAQAFGEGKNVIMSSVPFVIAKAKVTAAGHWEYQLKAQDSAGLFENGRWVEESKLKWA
jgi:hypothetical protein